MSLQIFPNKFDVSQNAPAFILPNKSFSLSTRSPGLARHEHIPDLQCRLGAPALLRCSGCSRGSPCSAATAPWWGFHGLSQLPGFLPWRALYLYSLFVLLPNYEQQLRLHTYNLYSQFLKFPHPEFSTAAANEAYSKFHSSPQSIEQSCSAASWLQLAAPGPRAGAADSEPLWLTCPLAGLVQEDGSDRVTVPRRPARSTEPGPAHPQPRRGCPTGWTSLGTATTGGICTGWLLGEFWCSFHLPRYQQCPWLPQELALLRASSCSKHQP